MSAAHVAHGGVSRRGLTTGSRTRQDCCQGQVGCGCSSNSCIVTEVDDGGLGSHCGRSVEFVDIPDRHQRVYGDSVAVGC